MGIRRLTRKILILDGTTMSDKDPVLWGCDHSEEIITHTDRFSAIEDYLDGLDLPFPKTIKVYGYAPMKTSVSFSNYPLERVLEDLDEEYANPDGEGTKPTEAMKEAEKAFIEVVEREYKSWMCEVVITEEVVVEDWVKEHHPEWLANE